jgi:large subunit ribosomal protein L10
MLTNYGCQYSCLRPPLDRHLFAVCGLERRKDPMSLNLDEKKAVVAEVAAQVANAQTIAIAEYRGVEVTKLTVLRRQARESGVYLRVLKNTLVRRAVADTPFAGLGEKMVGPLIYSISADPVAAAKVLNDFAKTNDKLVLKAGSYAGKVLDTEGVQALASIPSRDELLARLLGVMQAPVSGFAVVLAALAKQRGGSDEPESAEVAEAAAA